MVFRRFSGTMWSKIAKMNRIVGKAVPSFFRRSPTKQLRAFPCVLLISVIERKPYRQRSIETRAKCSGVKRSKRSRPSSSDLSCVVKLHRSSGSKSSSPGSCWVARAGVGTVSSLRLLVGAGGVGLRRKTPGDRGDSPSHSTSCSP